MYMRFKNKEVPLKDIRPSDLHIVDVATALSETPRWRSMLGRPIYVGNHCVQMARYFYVRGDYRNAYIALMHDSPEFILNDILPEIKDAVPQIRTYEKQVLWPLFQEAFNIPDITKEVDSLDKEMAQLEKKGLVKYMPSSQVYVEFMELYNILRERLEDE